MHDRQAPPEVLARFREIDLNADLLYVGEGKWMLGVYREGETRRLFARKQLKGLTGATPDDDELAPSAVVAKYKKMVDGWAPVFIAEVEHGFFGRMIQEFREMDWHFRHHADKKFEENLEASDLSHFEDERKARMYDYADSEARSVWRYTHRKPVSVMVG